MSCLVYLSNRTISLPSANILDDILTYLSCGTPVSDVRKGNKTIPGIQSLVWIHYHYTVEEVTVEAIRRGRYRRSTVSAEAEQRLGNEEAKRVPAGIVSDVMRLLARGKMVDEICGIVGRVDGYTLPWGRVKEIGEALEVVKESLDARSGQYGGVYGSDKIAKEIVREVEERWPDLEINESIVDEVRWRGDAETAGGYRYRGRR